MQRKHNVSIHNCHLFPSAPLSPGQRVLSERPALKRSIVQRLCSLERRLAKILNQQLDIPYIFNGMAGSLFVVLTPWPGLDEWLYWRSAGALRERGSAERQASPTFPQHAGGLAHWHCCA